MARFIGMPMRCAAEPMACEVTGPPMTSSTIRTSPLPKLERRQRHRGQQQQHDAEHADLAVACSRGVDIGHRMKPRTPNTEKAVPVIDGEDCEELKWFKKVRPILCCHDS